MTPVRDSLNRLAGERLVHSSPGEGFQVPLLSETELRALIDWHRALVGIALGRRRTITISRDLPQGHDGIGERTAILFTVIAGAAGSLELHWALGNARSEEHTSELQSLMRISYAVFCLKKKTKNKMARTDT